MHLGSLHQLPDLAADRRQLRRVHRGDVAVLVEQLLEAGDVAVRLGARHRRHQVVDDRGVRAALGLRPLAGVVDQERVDQRQVAQHGVGGACRGERGVLPGQPLQRAVLAEVDQRVRAETAGLLRRLQPAVRREVVVARGEVGVVVDRDRVLPEAARRLDQQHDVAGAQRRQHQLAVVVAEQRARRGTPGLLDPGPQARVEVGGPRGVLLRRDPHVRLGELRGGQPLLVLAARVDECMDERVARLGVGARGVLGHRQDPADHRVRVVEPEVVAGVAQPAQQPDGGDRRVQTDGVADPAVLGGVRREHEPQTALGRRDVAQPGVVDRDPRDPPAALGIGDVVRQTVLVDLLEGEGRGDDPAVELGDRHLRRGVQGRHPVLVGLPLRAAAGQAQALQDRDVQRSHALDVPRLVVAARARAGGGGPARGQHGHDQGVERAERVVQLVGRRAQGPGEDGDAHGLTRRVDRVGQRVGETGVPRHLVGPVVEDPDPGQQASGGRAASVSERASGPPPVRHLDRRLEALAGQQHGVGEEGVQLAQVLRAAFGEVAVRLRGHADRHRGELHQLRAGLLLPAQDHGRHAGRADPDEAVTQVLRGAQHASDDQVAALDGLRHRLVPGPRGVRQDELGATGPRGQQVGVGGGQQRDARTTGLAHGFLLGVLAPARRRSRGQCLASRWAPRCGDPPRHSGGTAPESHRVPVTTRRVPSP